MKPLPERLERFVATLENLDRSDRMQMLIEVAGNYAGAGADRAAALSGRAPRSGLRIGGLRVGRSEP